MTQTPPSRNSGPIEVHQPPSCQSISPEVRGMPTESSNDEFMDLRIALMTLGDPSDDMLRISKGLRFFVEKGQDPLIYSTAQRLYDYGLARSTNRNKAPRERQAFGKGLKSEMPTDKMQYFKIGDTNIGRDTNGDSVHKHEPGESMEDNASLSGLLNLSEEFALGLARLQNTTLHKDPANSQASKFNRLLRERNHLRHNPTNVTRIETLLREMNNIGIRHDATVDSAYMRRQIEVSTFYDSFDCWYRSALSASNDKKTFVRLRKKIKMPQHGETVEEFSSHILHLATAIQFDCAVLVSYLNWINREKVWGLLDESRYKAYCLVRHLMKVVEDDSVPQPILEALDAPSTCAASQSSRKPHLVEIDGVHGHDNASTGQKSGTFEDKLRQALEQVRSSGLETDGSTEAGDTDRRRVRKLMRILLPRSVLATFPEDMSKAVHDLFFAFTMLNTMRPNLYAVRKKAKIAVTVWARASLQAWWTGWANWYEIPLTQEYEQQRIEYLAMCENAKLLHEKLAPRLRFFHGNRPRVRVAKAASHSEKRCMRVRKAWDTHIQDIRNVFPLVTAMILEAGALVTCGARSETYDSDTQQDLEGRLQDWKSMDEDDDCMADEEGKEYWNIIFSRNG